MSSPSSRWQEPWLQVAVRGSGDGQLPAAVGLASCQGALSTLAEQVVGSAHQGPQAERHECEACVRAEWRHGHSGCGSTPGLALVRAHLSGGCRATGPTLQ